MDGDLSLLSLKWNNHKTAFLHIIGNLRSKSSYTDATLACNGKFYPVHRLVLSTCSEYFCDIFEQTNCKNPVIVLKDVECKNLEYLLDYMYIGEVNVKQSELASLVGAAEYLQIKGLAVPDEDVTHKHISSHKRTSSDYHRGSSPSIKKKRTFRDILESDTNNSDKNIGPIESSDISKSSDIGIDLVSNKKSNVCEPSFIPIKCEPQSDDDIVDDNFVLVSETDIKPQNSRRQLGNKNTNHSETEKDIVEKEEQFDLSEDDMNQPGPSGMYENDQYQHNLSGSVDSDASLSQIPEDAMGILQTYQEITSHHRLLAFHSSSKNSSPQPADTFLTGPVIEPMSSDPIAPNIRKEQVEGDINSSIYFCNYCNYSSTHKHHVLRHFATHTGFKRFHCAYCEKRFTNKANLNAHTLSFHFGEKPNSCDFCEFRTAEKSQLYRHMRIKHKITYEKYKLSK